jgi:hypothetical protein
MNMITKLSIARPNMINLNCTSGIIRSYEMRKEKDRLYLTIISNQTLKILTSSDE